MKRIFLLTFLGVLTLFLAACGSFSSNAEPIPTVVLNSPQGNADAAASSGADVRASARALPVESVSLSFPLTGSVTEVLVKEGDTVAAGDALVQLDIVILQADIVEAEANRTKAETQVAYLRRINDSSNEDIEAAEAEVDRLTAILEIANARLAQATLASPISGTVASVDIAPGETVTPGLIVVAIADLTQLEFETTDLSERDVSQVKAGQSVDIYIEALDQDMTGTVRYIPEQASNLGGDVIYEVAISLDEEVAGLRWGMSAEVTINVEE